MRELLLRPNTTRIHTKKTCDCFGCFSLEFGQDERVFHEMVYNLSKSIPLQVVACLKQNIHLLQHLICQPAGASTSNSKFFIAEGKEFFVCAVLEESATG